MKKLAMVLMLLLMVGCTDSDITKASKAAAGISSGLQQAEKTVEQLFASGELDKQDVQTVLPYIAQASYANDQFVAGVRRCKSAGTATKNCIAAAFSGLSQAVATLDSQGVTHIKNPQSRAKVEVTVSAVEASVGIVQAMLSGGN